MLNAKQPKLYQKFHKHVVEVLAIEWKNGEVYSIRVKYTEGVAPSVVTYYNDESRDFSLTYDGESVFEELNA